MWTTDNLFPWPLAFPLTLVAYPYYIFVAWGFLDTTLGKKYL